MKDTRQWDLFTERGDRLKADRRLQLKENIQKGVENLVASSRAKAVDAKKSVLRSFILLNFSNVKTTDKADEFISRPLKSLGGKSLLDLKDENMWHVVQGWMAEYKLHRSHHRFEEMHWLVS
jgi:predicted ATP-grasp superfamily ATP-dependent carboligase